MFWQIQSFQFKFILFNYFLYIFLYSTIHTSQEIQCLPYAGIFLSKAEFGVDICT